MNESLTGLLMRACALALTMFGGASAAPVVWTGPTITFTKVAFADITQPENQDHLTDQVILVRGDNEGMFNYALEPKYDRDFFASPLGTKWATSINNPAATISATNYAALDFVDWAFAYDGPGPALIGNITSLNAVVKLVGVEATADDDIYLDLIFTEFGVGGAYYSYSRSTPEVPEPAALSMVVLATLLTVCGSRRRCVGHLFR